MKEEADKAYLDKVHLWLKKRHSPRSAKRYLHDIGHYLHHMGKEGAEHAGYNDILSYIGRLRDKYENPQTVKSVLYALKRYYDLLKSEGIRTDHPCKSLKLKDKLSRDIQLQDLFSEGELLLLMEEREERYPLLTIRNRLIRSLLIWQAPVLNELCSLELRDIDLEAGTLHLRESRRNKGRELKLRPEQIMLLYRYINEDRPKLLNGKQSQRLLINKLGNAESGEGINYLVSTYRMLFTGRTLNPQTIRMSVIANMLKKGVDLRVVQAFAGHRYPSSTERYKQSDVEQLQTEVIKHHPFK